METRSRVRKDSDAVSHTPIGLANPTQTPSTLTHPSTQSTEQQPEPEMGWHVDPSVLNEPIEFMRQLESIGWNGGDNFFGGKHDEFCFVCGGSMELFGCQTCETCYHASCMSPTLDVDDVPSFWFCPHCVDRDLHIPPDVPTTFTHVSQTQPSAVYPSPNLSTSDQAATTPKPSKSIPPHSKRKPEGQMIDIAGSKQTIHTIARSLIAKPTASEPKSDSTKAPPGRQRRSYSPPKKRSKYSAFSSEVDKALAVIHKELETAASNGRSEGSLRERIQTLEQEVRLKDGQILLMTRELETVRNNGERETLKNENEELKTLVEKKDAELRDWRTKLKNLLGNDGQ